MHVYFDYKMVHAFTGYPIDNQQVVSHYNSTRAKEKNKHILIHSFIQHLLASAT